MLGVCSSRRTTKEAPVSEHYAGKQFVGIDLHRRRSVIVRMTEAGEKLETVRIDNDPVALGLEIAKARPGSGGGAGGDVRLVLGDGRLGAGRGVGAFGAPAGHQ